MLSILLLDCSQKLIESLAKQGFNVQAGTIGYSTGQRHLPAQLYEYEVIIYNPTTYVGGHHSGDITNLTPEVSLDTLQRRIENGATCLVFLNRVSNNITFQYLTYHWIPSMPKIEFTKDNRIITIPLSELARHDYDAAYCTPLLSSYEVKMPVLQKISAPQAKPALHEKQEVVWLYANFNNEYLGLLIRQGMGQIIILPQYKSNDDVISIFVRRVLPKIYSMSSRKDLLVDFKSPDEQTEETALSNITTELANLEEEHEKALERLSEVRRRKREVIEKDETATMALRYLDTAYQQEDVALFYIYKVVEAVDKKLGGETKAKATLKTNAEHNFIGEVTNASYGDVRHAPSPGEIVKKWSKEDIKKCFTYAEIIICRYLATLFKS